MTKAGDLLKAEFVGLREIRANASKYLNQVSVITMTGKPRGVLVPYEMMLGILERLENVGIISKN